MTNEQFTKIEEAYKRHIERGFKQITFTEFFRLAKAQLHHNK